MTIDDKDKRIAELEATIAKLLARIDELQRRLGINSTHSSKPLAGGRAKELFRCGRSGIVGILTGVLNVSKRKSLLDGFCGIVVSDRMVRQGVLWRKMSFGTQSERGARYVERVLTVCATSRLRSRSAIEFLRQACHCHMQNLKAPSLVG